MPPNVTAILMKADPGAELACRARNLLVGSVQRGVISYYASRSLPDAPTVGLWLEMIEADVADDRAADRLSAFHEPALQLVGDPATPVPAASAPWFVLSRSEGCVELSAVARGDRLSRVPISPDDYADMMRARGHQATLGRPPGFPLELAGKVVMVKIRDDHAPVFVHEDVCKQAGGRH